jgi:hypothetical protein
VPSEQERICSHGSLKIGLALVIDVDAAALEVLSGLPLAWAKAGLDQQFD